MRTRWCWLGWLTAAMAQAAPTTPQIVVDQFGWRPADRKLVVLADPQKGQNAANHYVPGPALEVRRAADNTVVLSARPTPWKNGATDPISGDKCWLLDVSELRQPGRYVVADPQSNVQSAPFDVRDDVYAGVLRTAVRVFYYQRCGVPLEAKYGGNWNRPVCHAGETAAQMVRAGKPEGPARDVSGGWHDAGDHNKYVPFLNSTLADLLFAYELNPLAFGDDTGIPESGNGQPDLLDELRYEFDWLLKMQLPDGSVCNRVTALTYNSGKGPHDDKQPYYVTPPTTWATATFAASLAHGARVFGKGEYGDRLLAAAVRAWQFLQTKPDIWPANGQDGAGNTASAAANCNANEDLYLRVYAAAELFRSTGEAEYDQWFRAHARERRDKNAYHPLLAGWVDPLGANELTQAFVAYSLTPGHDPALATAFARSLQATLTQHILGDLPDDPYQAPMFAGHYCWGSNSCKCKWGHLLQFAQLLKLDPAQDARLADVAAGYAHYLHGRNPLSLVYLTNMGDRGAKLGATRSVMELFHGWFQDGSPLYDGPASQFGPAPGYLAGGPNQFFGKAWVKPPFGEPPAKAFREWNTGWNAQHNDNEDPWAINEPAIYYQAAYVLLLAGVSGAQ